MKKHSRMIGKRAAAAIMASVLAVSAVPSVFYAEALEKEETEETLSEAVPEEEETEEILSEGVLEEKETGETVWETESPLEIALKEEMEEAEAERTAFGVEIDENAPETVPGEGYYIAKNYPFYIRSMEPKQTLKFPLYFINGVMDVPYMELMDFCELLADMNKPLNKKYELHCQTDDSVFLITRETGYSMLVDFDKDEILFDDYDAFLDFTGFSLLDPVSDHYRDENGNPRLIERLKQGTYDWYGNPIKLDLAAYDIHLHRSYEDGLYLVPMQTLADFLIAPKVGLSVLFNKQAVFFGTQEDFAFNDEDGHNQMGEAYHSAPKGMLSDELAWFSYCELCLEMDNLYGQKEAHRIRSFDEFFRNTGLRDRFLNNDPNEVDGALTDFVNYYLDDLHSDVVSLSYLTEDAKSDFETGRSKWDDEEAFETYINKRSSLPQPIEAYEEYGNTAYITFDRFIMYGMPADYYDGKLPYFPSPASVDTGAMIIEAHKRITREDSPIENVVIDLSLNGGGDADAAAFVLAWFLGTSAISIRNTMTGAISTGTYRADVNLDGVFDEKDTVKDKNLFCLVSPYSFSCANLVPSALKASHNVTILGKETGGGSSLVLAISTAYGNMFKISSPYNLSSLKNGSYYDVDRGVEPDFPIVNIDHFYDRQALTDYINQLF